MTCIYSLEQTGELPMATGSLEGGWPRVVEIQESFAWRTCRSWQREGLLQPAMEELPV